MRTVHKFFIPLSAQWHPLPLNVRRLLHVGVQQGEIAVWCEVDDSAAVVQVPIEVMIYGTGHPLPPDVTYIGTVIIGDFVWHVFAKNYEGDVC